MYSLMCAVRLGGHVRFPCVYYLCLAGRVSFSTGAPVHHWPQPISEGHRPVFQVPALCGGTRPPKTGTNLPSGLSKPGERTHWWVGFEPTTSWSTVQRITTEQSPLCNCITRNHFNSREAHLIERRPRITLAFYSTDPDFFVQLCADWLVSFVGMLTVKIRNNFVTLPHYNNAKNTRRANLTMSIKFIFYDCADKADALFYSCPSTFEKTLRKRTILRT